MTHGDGRYRRRASAGATQLIPSPTKAKPAPRPSFGRATHRVLLFGRRTSAMTRSMPSSVGDRPGRRFGIARDQHDLAFRAPCSAATALFRARLGAVGQGLQDPGQCPSTATSATVRARLGRPPAPSSRSAAASIPASCACGHCRPGPAVPDPARRPRPGTVFGPAPVGRLRSAGPRALAACTMAAASG